MDFAGIPPEINSALMYAGAGSGPMLAAAAAWNALGAELATTASSYESVISQLAGEEWLGPASAAMAAAAAPYTAWMNSTAAAAEHAAAQAMASAAAFEAAFAMTVPPAVIAANRAQLVVLVATNILGQNTPAIAANEALYGEMWAQDAAAMYGYAGSSAIAGRLRPLTSPTPNTNPAELAGQAAAVSAAGASSTQSGLSQLVSTLPTAVGGLASPLAGSSDPAGILGSLDSLLGIPFVSNAINGSINTVAWVSMNAIPTGVSLMHSVQGSGPGTIFPGIAAGEATAGLGAPVLAGAVAPAGAAGFGPVLAGVGQASPVGGLSVPAAWSAATPAGTSAATLAGTGWTAAAEETPSMATLPAGMPAVASAGRGGFGFGAPRYGVKPTVMARPVMAG